MAAKTIFVIFSDQSTRGTPMIFSLTLILLKPKMISLRHKCSQTSLHVRLYTVC